MMLVFRVPLPPVALSPNRTRNVHWSVKHAAVEQYKRDAGYLARDAANRAKWSAPAKARISLLFGLKGKATGLYHPSDWDNGAGAMKAAQDGIVLAGVLRDDNWAALEVGSIAATFEDGPWVEIRLEVV